VQLLDDVHIQEYTIRALRPYTKHYIQVAARTTPGCGAKSQRMLFFTMEDSKLNLIKVCPDHTISRVRFSFWYHSRTQSPSYARCDEGLWPNP
jgi:hypothetical protein